VNPVLAAADGTIVAGHGRVLAAKKLGLDTVPVVPVEHLSEEERRAYVIADNRLAELAGWDQRMLASELQALESLDEIPIEAIGFTNDELKHLLGEIDAEDAKNLPLEPELPPVPINPVSRKGDLWTLGNHRILCGDSTSKDDVARVLGGEKAKLFSTDPPYCVDYTGKDRPVHEGRPSGKDWSHVYREIDIKDLGGFLDGVLDACLGHLEKGTAIYMWHAHVQQPTIAAVFERHGLLFHQVLVWVKPVATFGHSYYRWKHEPCAFGWKQGEKPKHGFGQLDSVWEVDWEGKSRVRDNEHPTQKPLKLFEIPMEAHTQPGDLCLEPFSGSGSQIIAGERLGRHVRAIEISPAFVDVAIRRWQDLTSKEAVLDDGRTFAAVTSERLGI
jgi:DNA modification methylase